MNYELFSSEMRNLKNQYESADKIQSEIDKMFYELTGVKAIRYDIEHVSPNPQLAEQRRLDLIEEMEEKEKELDNTYKVINYFESHLNLLPSNVREWTIQKFIQGKTFAEVGRNVGYSANGIYQRIKREVEKI